MRRTYPASLRTRVGAWHGRAPSGPACDCGQVATAADGRHGGNAKEIHATIHPGLVAFTCFLVCASAQAKWGRNNACGVSTYPTDTHCYAVTGVETPAYATIGYQDAVYASLPECSNAEAFVSQEEWTAPKSTLAGGWIEDGELTGGGYCDNKPHIFFDERSPTRNEIINFEESSLPTYGNQYNYFAISDLPEKNGRWYTYWRIPNEGSTWSLYAAWGGGWSAKTLSEEAGMEISDESKPTYEGKRRQP
jgi:hypothetical protein